MGLNDLQDWLVSGSMTSKSMKFLKFELDVHVSMFTSQRSTPVHIFISIHSAGASPHIGENIMVFVTFSWLYCILSRVRAQVEPVSKFSPLMAHTT